MGEDMKINYLVEVTDPWRHIVRVSLFGKKEQKISKLSFFLPSWSPGSYLMREYARHIRRFEATQSNGEVLFFSQVAKNIWEVDWTKSEVKNEKKDFQITYEIYCKELTVRTSHVDESHAFLHGPSYLMGILNENLETPEIEFKFPPQWSKLSTSLRDISTEREKFNYQAKNYDELIDCPVEIGCHETDGFELFGKSHFLAHYGIVYPHKWNLKEDIKKIVAVVARQFDNELPYDQYLFINHFVPKLFGGLEHLNSTALQFDGRKFSNRKDYLNYLSLVAHEYFHLWNVKRIRPKELGPFDYLNENYTKMLWLAEGLTSFMDDLFIYRSGLSSLEEYLDVVKSNLEIYFSTPGRKFHSLEQSSFNAWIKLYRPDENSKNSSVSYYLKGGLVFMALHSLLLERGKSIDDLLRLLWKAFKSRPEKGINQLEFYNLVETLGGKDCLSQFSSMVETTAEIDFNSVMKSFGLELRWHQPQIAYLGIEWEFRGERVFIKSVSLDSPSYKSGLNAGDELLFINNLRVLRDDAEKINQSLQIDTQYEFLVSRLDQLVKVSVLVEKSPSVIKEIGIIDREMAQKSFSFKPIDP
jgi:predicted metalloprotease with PDZ domain